MLNFRFIYLDDKYINTKGINYKTLELFDLDNSQDLSYYDRDLLASIDPITGRYNGVLGNDRTTGAYFFLNRIAAAVQQQADRAGFPVVGLIPSAGSVVYCASFHFLADGQAS